MACFPVKSLKRKATDPVKGCDFCKLSQCYIKLVKCQISKALRWKLLCPLCIENYVERSILNKINAFVTESFIDKGKYTVQRYDPLERDI
jgi:hypothetical protein